MSPQVLPFIQMPCGLTPALKPNTLHEVIDHAEAYVRGNVHTNGLENFWSLFKRNIYGTYQCVAADHLDRYLDEAGYRFNERKLNDADRFAKVLSQTHYLCRLYFAFLLQFIPFANNY